MIRIIRRDRLLSSKDLRFDGQLFTLSQLSLQECNMKWSTLSGSSIEGSRAISNGYASRCVNETGFSPQLVPPQKTVGCCRPQLWFLTRFRHSLRHDVAIHWPRDPSIQASSSQMIAAMIWCARCVRRNLSLPFQYGAVDAGVCALLKFGRTIPTEDHVTSKSLLKNFFNGSGPT